MSLLLSFLMVSDFRAASGTGQQGVSVSPWPTELQGTGSMLVRLGGVRLRSGYALPTAAAPEPLPRERRYPCMSDVETNSLRTLLTVLARICAASLPLRKRDVGKEAALARRRVGCFGGGLDAATRPASRATQFVRTFGSAMFDSQQTLLAS